MEYEKFKKLTIEADHIISRAKELRALSDDFVDGFHAGMWEAREIFMQLESESESATNE